MPIAKLNDANIYYEMIGQGHPVVLIAGYTCDNLVWFPVIKELSKKFKLLLFDNRGVGRTTDSGIPLSAELMAHDVIKLIDYLGLEKPHIVGHSMGGTIAQWIGHGYSEKISKLCILGSSVKWRKATILGLKSSLLLRKAGTSIDLIFAENVPWLFGEKFLQNEANIQLLKNMMIENPYPQSLFDQERQFRILETFDSHHLLKKIKAPTLIGYGEEDLLSLPFEAKFLAKEISGSKLVSFPCAHIFHSEVPELWLETVGGFLASSA